MVLALTSQERRELFAELIEHYRNGECSAAEFVQATSETGVSADDVQMEMHRYRIDNVRNWRNR